MRPPTEKPTIEVNGLSLASARLNGALLGTQEAESVASRHGDGTTVLEAPGRGRQALRRCCPATVANYQTRAGTLLP